MGFSEAANSIETGSINTCEKGASSYQPIQVEVKFEILDIRNIDPINQTFEADFNLTLYWPIEASKSLNNEVTQEAGWQPKLDFINAVSLENKMPNSFKNIDFIDAKKRFNARYSGTFAAPMSFERFPFDSHQLQILLEDYVQEARCVNFTVAENNLSLPSQLSISREWSLSEQLSELMIIDEAYQIYPTVNYSRVVVAIQVNRKSEFYDYKIVGVSFLIVLFSLFAFACSPARLSIRVGITTTAFFVLLMHCYFSLDAIPRIPNLTVLDMTLIGLHILVFMSAIQHLIVSSIYQHSNFEHRDARCKRIDRLSVLIFALMLLGLLVLYQSGHAFGKR